jgi:flagellar protein FlaG
MSNISVTPSSGYPKPVDGPGPGGISPEARTFNVSVTGAVRQLNEAGYAGEGREVTYSIDPASRAPVIKVIDSSTKEVVTQLPSKYVLALAADYYSKTKDSR